MTTQAETERILAVLDDLQKGECWIGYNAMQVLHAIDEKAALHKGYDAGNSIWQLVNHISYWRKHLVKRLAAGQEVAFEGPDFYQPPNADKEAWENTLKDFDTAYLDLRVAIAAVDPVNFDVPLNGENVTYTYYKQIMGAMQHDAFHLGQIMLIRRMYQL